MNDHDKNSIPEEAMTEKSLDRSSRRAPIRPVQFTRPMSSQGDLASGFSFAKPKPLKPLNHGIAVKPVKTFALPKTTKTSAPEAVIQVSPHLSPPAQDLDVRRKSAMELSQPVSGHVGNILNDASTVPFPFLQDSVASEGPRPLNESETRRLERINASTKDHNIGQESSDNTWVGSVVQSSAHQHAGIATGMDQRSKPNKNNAGQLKPPKKKRGDLISRPNARMTEWMKNEEDAMHLLMFHRQKLLQQHNDMLATQRAQEEQIANCKDVEVTLKAELEDSNKRLGEREAECREMQVLKPRLQARVRTFKDFLNGLREEHTQLYDVRPRIVEEGQEARNEHQELKADINAAKTALDQTQEAIKRERVVWTRELMESEHQIQLLKQTIQSLQVQLDQAHTVSSNERARYEKLDQSILQVHKDHEQLMSAVVGSHEEVSFLCLIFGPMLNAC